MEPKELIRKLIVYLVTLEAKAVVKKYRPQIILVTGSVGKTSAKDAIYTTLSGRYFVRRSEKSYNSDIGVPLTVLGVPNGWSNPVRWIQNLVEGLLLILLKAPYPEWLVIEVGADRPGDISKSLAWLSPRAVVLTRFPDVPVHVEFYTSPEELVREELSPTRWISQNGYLIVNADDVTAAEVPVDPSGTRISYGFGKGATVRANHFRVTAKNKVPTGISFDIVYRDLRAHVSVPDSIGKSHAYAVLAGVATAVLLGVSFTDAVARAGTYLSPPGRMRIIPGTRGTTLIDDSYNASPVATEEALRTLEHIPRAGRRIAVLADMLELGSFSVAEHRRIGGIVATTADYLLSVGIRGKGIAEGARLGGMSAEHIHEFERGADAATFLLSLIQEGDVILIKGSQSMRMERVVKSLMARPETAPTLLARQDEEWLAR